MAKIIIVEDDFKVANFYKERLLQDGHEVTIVSDEKALETIRSQKPDLVLLDILMPKVSGMSILREIKTDQGLEDTPVLILTNVEGATELAQAITLGASGYLVKADTTMEMLSDKVKEALDSSSLATGVKS